MRRPMRRDDEHDEDPQVQPVEPAAALAVRAGADRSGRIGVSAIRRAEPADRARARSSAGGRTRPGSEARRAAPTAAAAPAAAPRRRGRPTAAAAAAGRRAARGASPGRPPGSGRRASGGGLAAAPVAGAGLVRGGASRPHVELRRERPPGARPQLDERPQEHGRCAGRRRRPRRQYADRARRSPASPRCSGSSVDRREDDVHVQERRERPRRRYATRQRHENANRIAASAKSGNR